MMVRTVKAAGILVGLVVAGCASDPVRGQLANPDGVERFIHWDASEMEQKIAMRTLRKTEHASFHLVRADGDEKPHIHERSDLVVFILAGNVRLHLGELDIKLGPGDMMEIPKGTKHWVENVGPGPSEAYAIFTPAFDGKDRKFIRDAEEE